MLDVKLFYCYWRHGLHLGFLEVDVTNFTFTLFSFHHDEQHTFARWFDVQWVAR